MVNSKKFTKNLYYRLIGLVLLLFSASGCQTVALFEFESLEAPKVVLPPDIKTIGFVDRNLNFEVDTVSEYYLTNSVVLKDTNNYDEIRSINCHLGLSENLSYLYSIDSISFTRLPKKRLSGDRVYPPISWQLVDSICELTRSDILICLEDIQIFNEYEIISGDENWGVTDIKYFVVWRIYDPLLQKFHDERVISDSLYTEVNSNSYTKLVEEKIPNREEINAEISYEIGRNYANLISPVWKKFIRNYFITGHSDFTLANYYFNNDGIDQAIEIWKKHTESENKKLAGRASYNLALAYELKEDFKEANHWMRKSISIYRSMDKIPSEFKYAKDYFKNLTMRTQNNYLLDKFFGIEKE